MILVPELVPARLQGKAPRTRMRPSEWDAIRASVLAAADFRCSACGSRRNPQAHERYHVEADVLVLDDIVCLCQACHNAVHIGRAFAVGRGRQAVARLARIDGISMDEAEAMAVEALALWRAREHVDGLDWSLVAVRWPELLSDETRREAELSGFV